MGQEPTYVVLFGPPASGKGTQAARLREMLHLPHIASGDLFRENIGNKTALGLKAKAYIDRGELVPDDVTIEDFARFREAVERSAGWPVVQEVNLYLSSASVDSPLLVMAVLAAFGAGASTGNQVSASPPETYLNSLTSACGACGGCWHNYPWADCYSCPNQPYWERVVAGTCYLVSTTLCLKHLLISLPVAPD